MAGIEVTLTSNKDEILEALNEQLGQAMIAIGMTAESNAKQEITKAVYDTPESPNYKRTGRLRNSITYGVDTSEPAVYIGSNVEYAPEVELGTSRMRARPYLKPAAENHASEYREIVKSALES